jgi:hypothetical protein
MSSKQVAADSTQIISNMSSLSEFKQFKPKTTREIYAKLNPPLDTSDPLAMFSKFPCEEGHVNYHDLRRLQMECGCSGSSCMKIRCTKTENKEVFDVVKMINGIITIVPNDVVII